MANILKILVIAIVATFILIAILSAIIARVLLSVAQRQKKPENAMDSEKFVKPEIIMPEPTDDAEKLTKKLNDDCYKWLKATSKVVSIQSEEGLKLNAYFAGNFPSKPKESDSISSTKSDSSVQSTSEKSSPESATRTTHKYGIFVHGHRSEPHDMSSYAKHFFDKGYSVLVPGLRGHGWSEGTYVDMGAFSARDILLWAKWISQNDADAKIVLLGVSMGSATVMMTTGLAELPKNVVAAISDCGYSDLYKQYKFILNKNYHLPKFPILNWASLFSKIKCEFSFDFVRPVDRISKSKTPTLFIHGNADTYVSYSMLDEVFNAASCPKEKLTVENARHAESAFQNPELYWKTVDTFVEKWI